MNLKDGLSLFMRMSCFQIMLAADPLSLYQRKSSFAAPRIVSRALQSYSG
jgi:hypothetical protein